MNAKQEILETLAYMETVSDEFAAGAIRDNVPDIRAILETHTLEPIDDRPFDPTLCGFKRIHENIWKNDICTIIQAAGRLFDVVMNDEQIPCYLEYCPWPATQSEGKRLLELLGVLG